MLKKNENKEITSIEKFMVTSRATKKDTNKKDVSIRKKQISSVAEKDMLKTRFSKKNIALISLVVILMGALGIAGYFYYQYKKATSPDVSKIEMDNYIAKISKFMVLPQNEIPTIATVANKDKLVTQSFFANAENGDKVLFYTKSQKAILYRPSTNMIIEAASMVDSTNVQSAQDVKSTDNSASQQLSVGSNPEPQAMDQSAPKEQNQSSEVATAPKMTTVVVYNGTLKKGLAQSVSNKLASVTEAKVVSTGNAKGDYAKTLVVDLSGSNLEVAKKIADTLGAMVGDLPATETKPDNTDIVIIGGNDFKD